MSLIVLFGTWLSCIKLKFETKGFVKNIELDGGAVMNSLIVTYMWVQMEYIHVPLNNEICMNLKPDFLSDIEYQILN